MNGCQKNSKRSKTGGGEDPEQTTGLQKGSYTEVSLQNQAYFILNKVSSFASVF